MKRALILAPLLLAGCASINDMRGHQPDAVYTSARSPAALEACLAGKLSWIALPAIIHGEGATELSFGSAEGLVALITLRPLPQGTKVEARQLLAYGGRIRSDVEACVGGVDR